MCNKEVWGETCVSRGLGIPLCKIIITIQQVAPKHVYMVLRCFDMKIGK